MKGHEYPRQLLAEMLAVQVPLRLDVIRAALTEDLEEPVTWPPDPKAYLLADELPLKEEKYPAVLITSSRAAVDSNIQAGLGEFIYEYAITVGCAVVADRHGGETKSSLGRDRILLAIREALLLNAQLATDCFAVVRAVTEETGAAVETMQGKAMSLGNITFAVRVIEELSDPILDPSGDPAVITTHAETITAVDATEDLP